MVFTSLQVHIESLLQLAQKKTGISKKQWTNFLLFDYLQ